MSNTININGIEYVPAADVQPVGKFAQFTDGVWREVTKGSAGVTLYEHQPASPDVQELVGALQFVLDEFECLVDICWDADHIAIQKARAALAKWEGK